MAEAVTCSHGEKTWLACQLTVIGPLSLPDKRFQTASPLGWTKSIWTCGPLKRLKCAVTVGLREKTLAAQNNKQTNKQTSKLKQSECIYCM